MMFPEQTTMQGVTGLRKCHLLERRTRHAHHKRDLHCRIDGSDCLVEYRFGDDTKLKLLIEALRVPANIALAREAAAIKFTIKPGVDNYQERNEADTKAARRPAQRLTLIFKTKDEPYPQRQEYLLVRAGGTVFKILVQGPDAEGAAIGALFAHAVATLAVAA